MIAEYDRCRFERNTEQVLVPSPRDFEPYFVHLACCLVWTGTMSPNGSGRFFVNRDAVPVQEYARQLYRIARPPDYYTAGLGPKVRDKVLRCTVAGTKNCVHRDHLGWVASRTNPCEPTELALRDSIRYHFTLPPDHPDRRHMQDLARTSRLGEARVCRILLYLDGADDQRKYEELRIPALAE